MVFSSDAKRKAQLSVEFFLVLSIIIAFSMILYNISKNEVARTKALDAAVISKNSLDSLTQATDFAALSGNGSALNVSVFVPPGAYCFYYNTTRKAFYCIIANVTPTTTGSVGQQSSDQQMLFVYGARTTSTLQKNFASLCASAIQQGGLSAGWWELRAQSNGDYVNVSCSRR
ncbi:MAG: hypothetical protein V1817_00940 [Candidatus Micrarchaeota archaeon]